MSDSKTHRESEFSSASNAATVGTGLGNGGQFDAPTPGVLSGEQICNLGIVRIPKRQQGTACDNAAEADGFGLSPKDRQTIQRPASIDLRVGRQYIDCQERTVRVQTRDAESSAVIKLPPLGCIIFSTLETIHTPENVVGRFDLKIGYALQGLVLQVGPQIEPMYRGPLFGLLINLSDAEICLADNVFLTAEFSLLAKTNTPLHPKQKSFEDLKDFLLRVPDVAKGIRTARLASVQQDLEDHNSEVRLFRAEVNSFRSEANALKGQRLQFTAITIAAFGLLVSVTVSIFGLIVALTRTAPATTHPIEAGGGAAHAVSQVSQPSSLESDNSPAMISQSTAHPAAQATINKSPSEFSQPAPKKEKTDVK